MSNKPMGKQDKKPKQKLKLFNKFLNIVENVGNKLPHPVTIFMLFALAVIIISEIASRAGFINLFIGSASAKWGIMAPVFVPMLYRLNFSPEFTQLAYRIGDSTTNIISPLMTYFAVIVVFAQKYDEDTGIGTLISTMLPYSIIFLLGWILLLAVWYGLGIAIGPEAFIRVQ